jgi:hypothetical protein
VLNPCVFSSKITIRSIGAAQVTAIGLSALEQTSRRPDGDFARLLVPRGLVLEKGR